MFLPLWTLEELQHCRGSVDIFSSTVTAELAELAFEFAGGLPRTVLQLPAQTANASIPIRSLIVGQPKTAVNRLPSEVIRCSLLLLQRLVTGNRCVGKPQKLIYVLSCCLAFWHNKPEVEVRGNVDQLIFEPLVLQLQFQFTWSLALLLCRQD